LGGILNPRYFQIKNGKGLLEDVLHALKRISDTDKMARLALSPHRNLQEIHSLAGIGE
jgi:hypothetical protein